jgi:hypothetical protein
MRLGERIVSLRLVRLGRRIVRLVRLAGIVLPRLRLHYNGAGIMGLGFSRPTMIFPTLDRLVLMVGDLPARFSNRGRDGT